MVKRRNLVRVVDYPFYRPQGKTHLENKYHQARLNEVERKRFVRELRRATAPENFAEKVVEISKFMVNRFGVKELGREEGYLFVHHPAYRANMEEILSTWLFTKPASYLLLNYIRNPDNLEEYKNKALEMQLSRLARTREELVNPPARLNAQAMNEIINNLRTGFERTGKTSVDGNFFTRVLEALDNKYRNDHSPQAYEAHAAMQFLGSTLREGEVPWVNRLLIKLGQRPIKIPKRPNNH